jgi:hypothetical protein
MVAIAVVGAMSAGSAGADDPKDKGPPITGVELKDNPAIAKSGKIAIYKGQADKVGVAFEIPGLGIGTPVAVMLWSDKEKSLGLHVKNDMSKKWDKEVKTKDGYAEVLFRTEGPAVALVTGTDATQLDNYEIAIWVGKDIPFHKLQKPPFVSQAEYDKKHGAGSSTGAIIAVSVVIALGVFLIAMWRRNRRKGRAA